jgi:hypothetical protein
MKSPALNAYPEPVVTVIDRVCVFAAGVDARTTLEKFTLGMLP